MWWKPYMLTPETLARKTGYRRDQQGILRRYLLTSGAWDEHLRHTKEFIEQSVLSNKPEHVAVLGSGWLLDVPLKSLAASCREVHLFDLVHPRRIQALVRRFPTVHCHTLDLTGGWLAASYQLVRERRRADLSFVERMEGHTLELPVAVDFVVSVNLLSQLDELLVDFLYDSNSLGREAELPLRRAVQQAHLRFLSARPSALVTDIREDYVTRWGQRSGHRQLLLADMPVLPSQSWEWNFDPRGTYRDGVRTTMQVGAWFLDIAPGERAK